MATKVTLKTTFEASKVIEPIYTGGDVSATVDGHLLATCTGEDVSIVEASSGRVLARIEGDGETTTCLCISPDAQHVVICSRSLAMRVFRLTAAEGTDGLIAEEFRTLKPHNTPVVTCTIDSTGTLVATGGADGTVKVWDIRGGFSTHTFHGHGGVVSAALLFKLQNPMSTSNRRPPSTGRVLDKDDQADSLFLASGGEDGKIMVWDLNTRKFAATLDAHVSVVRSLSFSSSEQLLLSASRDRTMIFWHPERWKQHKVIPAFEVLETAGFVPDTNLCYSGGENGVIRIWSTISGKEVTVAQKAGHDIDSIVAIIPIPINHALLSIHQDQSLKFHLYDQLNNLAANAKISPLPILRRMSGNHDEIIDMAFVGANKSLLALATNTESVRLVSVKDSKINSDQSQIGFGSDEGLLEGHEDIIICLDVDWSGNWIATGAKDNTARLWRIDESASKYYCVAVLAGHAQSVGAVSLPRNPPLSEGHSKGSLDRPPQFMLTGSQDKTIKRWDTSKLTASSEDDALQTTVRALYTRVAHEKDINALDVSPIAPLFASASQDKTIKIWSLEDGSVAGILRGHKRGVWSIRFSPAGTPPINLAEGGSSSAKGLLVSGSGDRTVKVWSLATYTCLLTFEGHSNSVLKVIWLPPPSLPHDQESEDLPQQRQAQTKQSLIASASSDTLVKIWSPYVAADSDHLLTTLDNHTDRVWALTTPYSTNQPFSASPCPYPLVSGAADATITFWKDTTTQTATVASQKATERIEQDQLLQNHIHAKNYREVITLSLALNHPGRLLRVLEDVVNLPDSEKDPDTIMGSKAVDEILASLDKVQIFQLLERVRDWNTNARTATVAQRVLTCLFKSYPASFFTQMAQERRFGSAGKGMQELLRALEVYTERHYKRMEDLVDESYLLEYTLREMDDVSGTAIDTGKSLLNGHGQMDGNEDVIMV